MAFKNHWKLEDSDFLVLIVGSLRFCRFPSFNPSLDRGHFHNPFLIASVKQCVNHIPLITARFQNRPSWQECLGMAVFTEKWWGKNRVIQQKKRTKIWNTYRNQPNTPLETFIYTKNISQDCNYNPKICWTVEPQNMVVSTNHLDNNCDEMRWLRVSHVNFRWLSSAIYRCLLQWVSSQLKYIPPKTNGWRAPKWWALEKVTGPFKHGNFWYLCLISGVYFILFFVSTFPIFCENDHDLI